MEIIQRIQLLQSKLDVIKNREYTYQVSKQLAEDILREISEYFEEIVTCERVILTAKLLISMRECIEIYQIDDDVFFLKGRIERFINSSI